MVLIKDVETTNADSLVDVAHADVVVTAEVVNTLDDLSDKKKRTYCCSKCGQPKKGHQCQIPDDAAPPSPESKKRKLNEDNKSEDEQIKDDKDGKEDGSKSPHNQLHQLHNHLHVVHTDADLDHPHAEETGLEVSVNPEDIHDAEMRELDLFRKRVVRLCSRLQDTCSNLDENYHLYFRKVKQLALELEGVLVQLERYYLHSKDKESSNDNVSWQYYQDGKDDHKLNDSVDLKILGFCEVFAIDLLNEWYDDKGDVVPCFSDILETGWKNYIEERLFLLWEKAFEMIAMQSIVSPKDLEKPLEAATNLDFKGRLKLNFGHHMELNQLAIKYQTMAFKQNPNFNVYKTLMDKMCMDRDSEYFSALKNDLIDYLLNSNKPEHTVVKLQIMMFEKKYEQLKMLIHPLKSNDLVIEIAEQLAMLYPSDILNKAQKEIHQVLLDNVARLEDRFSPTGKAFEVWKSEGFKTLKERMQEAKNRKERKEKKKIPHNIFVPEDYEEDHYVHQLRETFTIDELEMNYYDTYMKKYVEFENIPDAFFEEPYESFKEMRLTERECTKVQHAVISWFKIARLAITSFNSLRRDMNLNQALSFESFVDGMQGIFIETIRSFGKEYLGIICSEMSGLLTWENILEREFIQLCSLYASFYTRTLLDFLEKKDQYFVVRLEQQM